MFRPAKPQGLSALWLETEVTQEDIPTPARGALTTVIKPMSHAEGAGLSNLAHDWIMQYVVDTESLTAHEKCMAA